MLFSGEIVYWHGCSFYFIHWNEMLFFIYSRKNSLHHSFHLVEDFHNFESVSFLFFDCCFDLFGFFSSKLAELCLFVFNFFKFSFNDACFLHYNVFFCLELLFQVQFEFFYYLFLCWLLNNLLPNLNYFWLCDEHLINSDTAI